MRAPFPRKRLKYVCERGGEYGLNVPASEYADKGVRLLRTTDLAGGQMSADDDAIFVRHEAVSPDDLLRTDDLLLSRSGTVGRAFLIPEDAAGMTYAGFLVRFRVGRDAFPRFIYYCTQTAEFQSKVKSEAITSTIQNFNAERYNNLAIPMPSLSEQCAIAAYLDRETAGIETFIGEQQCLMEILRERRQALIDESFSTTGWPSVQLRRYIRFLTSGSRGWGDYYADQGDRFLRIGNLPRADLRIRGDIQFVDLPEDVTEGSRTILLEGDLLFSITAYLGSVAVVESDWAGAYVSQHVALCRLERDRVDPRFLGWFMLSTTGQHQLKEGAAGGAKMQLALDDIRGLRVPAAPVEHQRRVAADLDRKIAKLDELVIATERLIEYARERRTSLITSVVAGQTDVRRAE